MTVLDTTWKSIATSQKNHTKRNKDFLIHRDWNIKEGVLNDNEENLIWFFWEVCEATKVNIF